MRQRHHWCCYVLQQGLSIASPHSKSVFHSTTEVMDLSQVGWKSDFRGCCLRCCAELKQREKKRDRNTHPSPMLVHIPVPVREMGSWVCCCALGCGLPLGKGLCLLDANQRFVNPQQQKETRMTGQGSASAMKPCRHALHASSSQGVNCPS